MEIRIFTSISDKRIRCSGEARLIQNIIVYVDDKYEQLVIVICPFRKCTAYPTRTSLQRSVAILQVLHFAVHLFSTLVRRQSGQHLVRQKVGKQSYIKNISRKSHFN